MLTAIQTTLLWSFSPGGSFLGNTVLTCSTTVSRRASLNACARVLVPMQLYQARKFSWNSLEWNLTRYGLEGRIWPSSWYSRLDRSHHDVLCCICIGHHTNNANLSRKCCIRNVRSGKTCRVLSTPRIDKAWSISRLIRCSGVGFFSQLY